MMMLQSIIITYSNRCL